MSVVPILSLAGGEVKRAGAKYAEYARHLGAAGSCLAGSAAAAPAAAPSSPSQPTPSVETTALPRQARPAITAPARGRTSGGPAP